MFPQRTDYTERNGLLSDREIRRLCIKPTHVHIHGSGYREYISAPFTEKETHLIEHYEYVKATRHALNLPSIHDSVLGPIVSVTDAEIADWKPMLTPFVNECMRVDAEGQKVISYGLSSYGYDLRAAPEFKIFTNVNSAISDPKNFDSRSYVDFEGDVCIIPANSFILARTLERFTMPSNVVADFITKSTLARVGVQTICTPAEPGWEGYLTLEFANTSPLPVKFYANEGCVQMRCFRSNDCDVTYADRDGKYMSQKAEITLPKV